MRCLAYLVLVITLFLLIIASKELFRKENGKSNVVFSSYECRPILESKYLDLLIHEKDSDSVSLEPWVRHASFEPITKEFFRCRGSSNHSAVPILREKKVIENVFDCSGSKSHSLPVQNDQEYIYPVLIRLLNWIQEKIHKRVVITTGHRCPQHHRYLVAMGGHPSSKHMIGAQVNFYVEGESTPVNVMKAILSYYETCPNLQKDREKYVKFTRSTASQNTSTLPWMNKEILIQFFRKNEGRDFETNHKFPYFSIQVRYDREKNCDVVYKPKEAEKIYRY